MTRRITIFTASTLTLLALLSPQIGVSQNWWNMMQDPDAQFEETVAAFDEFWGDRPVTKGSGWKPFQRWKYYMESRVAPDGSQSQPSQTLAEFEAYRQLVLNRSRRDNLASGNWTQLGPVNLPGNGTGQPNGMGRLTALAFHPTDANTMFVGAPAGAVWKTTDYGSSWTKLANGLVRLGVSSILIHPTGPDTIWIATGDRDGGDAPGYGVWKSTDGGASWAASNTGMGNRTVNEILMDPNNVNILIASTNNGIYRSVDGGDNWTQVLGGANIKDIMFKPGTSSHIYAAGQDFYRSTDNGVTWTMITTGTPTTASRIAVAVSADDPTVVYLFAGNGGGLVGIYRSTNDGASFVQQAATPNLCGYDVTGGTGSQAWYDLVALGDPADVDHLIVGAINTWESFDGGVTWTIMTHWVGSGGNPAVHADHHVLEHSPHTGDLFIGHDGGLHYSDDAGVSFTEVSSGLAIAQVYKIGQSQQTDALTINGYQDNGTAYYEEGTWITEIGGDGMECIIDYSDDNVMYGALYYGDIRRSTNGGTSFATIAENGVNGITESGAWVTPYKLHPSNPDTMYVGYRQLWRSYNCKSAATNAVTWATMSAFPGTSTIRDIAISESNPDVMYVSRAGGNNFYRTNNATAAIPTWTDLDANLPATSFPADIEIHPTNPNTLWIAMGNNIYESTDGGNSWTDISGTLPNIALNTIVFDDESPVEAMYVGMDVGVYYLDNTLADWELYMTGLPNVEVTELEIFYDPVCRGKDKLKAATYGRGLWESDLKDPGNLAPSACFEAANTEPCVGETVTIEDFSAYNPTGWSWTISPLTFSYTGGTNANSQNPKVVFNTTGVYTVRLVATNGNGSDLIQRVSYFNVGTSAAPPLTEDFESAGLCTTSNDCGVTVCPLPNGWVNLTNGSDDDIDWRVDEGGTASVGTGPTVDANPGTAIGNYIYLEASSCFGQTAIMESPCIDLTAGSYAFSFAYHMSGINMGTLSVDVIEKGVINKDVIPPIVGDQGTGWNYTSVDLSPYAGSVVTLRFRGETGPGYQSDIALDDFSFSSLLPVELITFAATLSESQYVDLNWEVESETSGIHYIVERQLSGNEFVMVDEIRGASLSSYATRDMYPQQGQNIYRLISLEENGSTEVLALSEVWLESATGLTIHKVFPNPFTGQTEVSISVPRAQNVQAILYNVLGQQPLILFSGELEVGEHTLPIEGGQLSAGQYMLRVTGASGQDSKILIREE